MAVRKRCPYCGKLFVADRRIGDRQKACSVQCQKLRKKDNNRNYSRNNPGYWHGRYDVVKQWRQQHPEYQKAWRSGKRQRQIEASTGEIQAEVFGKALEGIDRNMGRLREIQAEILLQLFERIAVTACSARRLPARYKPRCW